MVYLLHMKSLRYLGLGLLTSAAGGFTMALLLKLSEFFIIFIFGIAPIIVAISTFFYEVSVLSLLREGVKVSIITKFVVFIFFGIISFGIFMGFTLLFSNVLGVENEW